MGVKGMFAILFMSVANEIHLCSVDIMIMSAITQERLSKLYKRLLNPTFNASSQCFDFKMFL
ncbi:hypothetical protein BGX21_003749, partial [Mortierella sp. AD011]